MGIEDTLIVREEEVEMLMEDDFEERFGWLDNNGVDGVTVEEVEMVIRSLGQNPTADQIRDLICDGSFCPLEFAHFLNLITTKSKEKDTEEELKEAFKVFDKDQNGFISPTALRHVMINLGEKLTDEEVEQMIKEADSDGDGLVNFDDFVKFMMSV